MKNNRFLKTLAVVMSVFMIMTAIAIPTFADEPAALVPVSTDSTYDVWDGTFDTSPYDAITDKSADRSSAEPIIIDTAEKLAGLAKATNDAKKANVGSAKLGAFPNQKFYITKNIDLKLYDFPVIGESYDTAQFSGIIEGRLDGVESKAITIANLSIPNTYASHAAFVGTLRGGGMKNLTFLNAHVGNANNQGGTAIVAGYISKTIVCFENITIIDSTLTSGVNDTGYISACIKTDNDLIIKNCAIINSSTNINTTYAGGLVGHLQNNGSKTIAYGFENCYISGASVNSNEDAMMAGFVTRYSGVDSNKLIIKNCHYNATMKAAEGKIDDVDVQAIIVGDSSKNNSLNLEVDGLLITGVNEVTVDGSAPLINYATGTVTVDAKNIYSTVPVTTFSYNLSDYEEEIPVTDVTVASITGATASTTLSGLDFENVWTTRDGQIATLKIAKDDTFVAAPDQGDNGNGDNGNGDNGNGSNDDNQNNSPIVTQVPNANTPTEDDGGCGSVVSATCLVTFLTVGMGVTVIRKKKD